MNEKKSSHVELNANISVKVSTALQVAGVIYQKSC